MKDYKKYFHKFIGSYYPVNSHDLIKEIDQAFDLIKNDVSFAAHSKNPIDRRLEVCGYFLATIKVLEKHGESYDRIRELLIVIVKDFVRPKNKFQSFLKKLPAKLVGSSLGVLLLRLFDKKIRTKGHPEGFVARVITDNNETLGFGFGFDILECGICKLFTKHNCGRYVPILCEVDYITSNLAGLKLVRTGTIATGAHKCDFRFEKNK